MEVQFKKINRRAVSIKRNIPFGFFIQIKKMRQCLKNTAALSVKNGISYFFFIDFTTSFVCKAIINSSLVGITKMLTSDLLV